MRQHYYWFLSRKRTHWFSNRPLFRGAPGTSLLLVEPLVQQQTIIHPIPRVSKTSWRCLSTMTPGSSIVTASSESKSSSSSSSGGQIVDTHPLGSRPSTKVLPRLPMVEKLEEFPPDRSQALRRHQATVRILKIAASRLVEPPTLHLLGLTAWATMGLASLEAIILCNEWPWWESWEAGRFVWWYSIQQLVPSIVWDSQDATLIAKSLELDPTRLLRDLSLPNNDPALATALLRLHLLETVRFFVAGFMMIASIVRAAGVSAGAFSLYEEQIRTGREPPLRITPEDTPGVVIRFCGRDSFTTEVSLQKMGVHILPIFEIPDRVQHLVWQHSENLHRPIYWCVKENKYGSAYSWDQFPVDQSIFAEPWKKDSEEIKDRRKLLILEADATNPHDPLALGNAALDLNLDDASQGFRRLQERFSRAHPGEPKPFRTLRVYLGNSLEVSRTGGGHSYTLRHRVRYAKEIDVLIDSRAPVLERILEWCKRVAGSDRRIIFQTSSVDYFKSLQRILRCYGYEIYDPLDPRSLWLCQTKHYRATDQTEKLRNEAKEGSTERSTVVPPHWPASSWMTRSSWIWRSAMEWPVF